ncbi:MAG TPA: DegT/DnrJ/EryC1/StrS aminotransferase family protein [Candidatus Acidoferrales bacterium]|nr:DegT/DnrJ/EryC1/StrS aminotransferase family protein [Candidatus Acidoferrales bacterium]
MATHTQSDRRIRQTFLPYSAPSIGEEEIAEVVDSLRSGWITTGKKVQLFERAFADYLAATHAIAVSSCTAGLQIALAALGIGPGDEVVIPTLTFCSTANVVVQLGARPVLVDVRDDFNIDPESVEAAITPRTRAIIPVHYGGQPCDLHAIYALADRRGLAVIEDAAHAVGSSYFGNKIGSDRLSVGCGNFNRVTVFSFYANKNMTTGEGGMITTAHPQLAEHMAALRLHGMNRDAWSRYTASGSWYYEVYAAGYKANMTDLQAALGIHQLHKLDRFVETRQNHARLYNLAFSQNPTIQAPLRHTDRTHAYHLYVIRLGLDRLRIDRAQFINELTKSNIGTSVHFIPVHLHPFYQQRYQYKRGDLPNAERLYDRIVSLPIYPGMSPRDVQDTIAAVRQIAAENLSESFDKVPLSVNRE